MTIRSTATMRTIALVQGEPVRAPLAAISPTWRRSAVRNRLQEIVRLLQPVVDAWADDRELSAEDEAIRDALENAKMALTEATGS
jgi:hypothetical protein